VPPRPSAGLIVALNASGPEPGSAQHTVPGPESARRDTGPGSAHRYTVPEPGERHMTPEPGGNRVGGAHGDIHGDRNDRDAHNGGGIGAVPRRSGAVAVPGPPSVAVAGRSPLVAVAVGRTRRVAPRWRR
jgi:hypothetical protein